MTGIARIRTQKVLDNALVARLDDHYWRRYMECLLLAAEYDCGGRLPSLFDMAFRLHCDEGELGQDVGWLVSAGLLSRRDGYLAVNAPLGAMTNAERQAAYRER